MSSTARPDQAPARPEPETRPNPLLNPAPVEFLNPGGGVRLPRLLIVDDTITNRRLLMAILRQQKYEISEAEDGAAALEAVAENPPDLILLDIMMPVLDGYEVCARLKADPDTADIPIMFLSAMTQSEDKVKGLELGAVDYITKPYDRAEIIARVQTHLQLRALGQEMEAANRVLTRNQERIEIDLQAAAIIQESLIPAEDVAATFPELDIAWRFLPCNKIGGDVFNVVRLDENRIGFYMIDVSGHGVPSAMVTVSVSQMLYPQTGILKAAADTPKSYRVTSPAEVLRRLDEQFPMERFGKYFTMFYSVLDLRDGTLVSARGAHPAAFILRKNGEIETVQPVGSIVGLGGLVPFEEDERKLEAGDRLFLYTDGIVEYPNPVNDRFGDARLMDVLRQSGSLPLSEFSDELLSALESFSGGLPPEDDITFLVVEYHG